jgi:hypothetical protein
MKKKKQEKTRDNGQEATIWMKGMEDFLNLNINSKNNSEKETSYYIDNNNPIEKNSKNYLNSNKDQFNSNKNYDNDFF